MVKFITSLLHEFPATSHLSSQGQNLILNINDKGFTVVAYNRTTSKVDHFLANEAKGWLFHLVLFPFHNLIDSLSLSFRYRSSGCSFYRGARCKAEEATQNHPPR